MDPRSKKLLTLLENDCTLTHAQLAAMCDTTVEDIEMRIKSLTDEGVILGYKAMVNWEKTSVEAVEALIEVKITPRIRALTELLSAFISMRRSKAAT